MRKESWLEVCLTVDGELAEAVAEVLSRFAPNGVAIESAVEKAVPDGEGVPVGPSRVCAYLPADDRLEATRRSLEESLWFLGRIRPLPEPEYRYVQETDWAEAWKAHYHPIEIGERLVVVPAWLENPNPSRVTVRMDPGMAFGTGTHPSTRLCLEFVETLVKPGIDVIDVGCGSGILAIAALKLGAGRALGVDVDALSVRVARQNAALNGLDERLELAEGSLAEILAGEFSFRKGHLALANILAPVIVDLLKEGIGNLLLPGGRLALAGILDTQVAEVEAAAHINNLQTIEKRQEGDWVALLLRPSK